MQKWLPYLIVFIMGVVVGKNPNVLEQVGSALASFVGSANG